MENEYAIVCYCKAGINYPFDSQQVSKRFSLCFFLRLSFKPCTCTRGRSESALSRTSYCTGIGRQPATESEQGGDEVRSRA